MQKRLGIRWHAPVVLGALMALGLAACTTNTAAPQPCPAILIPTDGAKLTRFVPGPGRDIIDVVHEDQVSGFAHRCEYDTDASGAGAVTVEVYPAFESTQGPANQDSNAQFEFFIAIADQENNLLEKKRFPASIDFPQNMSRIQWQRSEPIALTIPLKAGQNGTDFQIFIGLQMTRAELDYQRKTR